jgi:hypothetical protein
MEEFIFRGILFRISEKYLGTIKALAIVSAVFATLHLSNDGMSATIFLSALLGGLLWCGIYMIARNIWVIGLHHAAWNLTVFFSGIPISGMSSWVNTAPIQSSYHGPVWLTGGAFGPEGSVITILVIIISGAFLFRMAKKRNQFITPPHP